MPKKTEESGEPRFPYTTLPNVLRRLLAEIPKRPKPAKLTLETLKAWSVSSDGNARTAIRVVRTLGLLGQAGEPTNDYAEFMKTGAGPALLAQRIKEVYRPLFESAIAPQNESDDELRKLFNIHSGGGERVMRLQIQTFKALSEHATFDALVAGQGAGTKAVPGAEARDGTVAGAAMCLPPVQIDLHIHLPENKTTREYEAIIQDIAKYIYGRDIE
jgi:hypothetical protein